MVLLDILPWTAPHTSGIPVDDDSSAAQPTTCAAVCQCLMDGHGSVEWNGMEWDKSRSPIVVDMIVAGHPVRMKC